MKQRHRKNNPLRLPDTHLMRIPAKKGIVAFKIHGRQRLEGPLPPTFQGVFS